MDLPQLQPQPPFFPFPATAFQNAAPAITSAQIIPEASQNHAANNATPFPAQDLNHPSYTDMIYAAITALKERDGSSKRAIAKYIERAYTGLPLTHSALLTTHLKRLKNTGLLVMVKKSYMLPRSDFAFDNSDNTAAIVVPPTIPHPHASADAQAVSDSGPKRGRGRPPKPKPNSAQSDLISSSQPNGVPPLNSQSVMVPIGLSISTQPNLAPHTAPLFTEPSLAESNVPNSSPGSQILGKRSRGRPRKAPGQPGAVSVVNSSGKRRGRPPKSVALGVKKSPGRPRKVKSGVKKNPKRLPKSVVVPYATSGAGPKPRGRPRKGEVLTAPAAGARVVPAKRQGRPPKVARPKMGARPVGRPKKSQSQADAYGDLKRKFEIFQLRVKQAVSLLKPTLNRETAITAIAAIQDLEEIATLDLNAPFKEEAPLLQPPQPQGQPPLLSEPPQQAAVAQN